MVAQIDKSYPPAGRVVRLASWALFEGRPLTTRGRALNPLVLALHHAHRRLPQLAEIDSPVFIMGMGRSGTTLLGKILSVHRDVGFLNEPKALWHVAVGREDVVGSYSRQAARYRLAATDASDDARHGLHRLVGAYLFWTRRRRSVDKNPEVVYRVPFLKAVFPQARFLLVVRNGWTVCRSVERWSREHGTWRHGERHDWWGADGRKWHLLLDQVVVDEPDLAPAIEAMRQWSDQKQMAAVEWIVAMRYGHRELESAPQSVLAVRFEDLLGDPQSALRSILRFCDLAADAAVLEYAAGVIREIESVAPFEVDAAVRDAFCNTLERLGYEPA